MDTHAHLSKTEIIGLLGGEFCSKRKVLHIHIAEPCNSVSTGMQCEMDPGKNIIKIQLFFTVLPVLIIVNL